MSKQYFKDRENEIQRQKTIEKEAKKLRQFLEDYVDERDDQKYYKFVFILIFLNGSYLVLVV
jgi:RNA-binding protein 25